jgi:hypothetical protein
MSGVQVFRGGRRLGISLRWEVSTWYRSAHDRVGVLGEIGQAGRRVRSPTLENPVTSLPWGDLLPTPSASAQITRVPQLTPLIDPACPKSPGG